MQAAAWSQASCDLLLIFLSLHMVMWAPSHDGRGSLPEADHMLLEPVQVAVRQCRDEVMALKSIFLVRIEKQFLQLRIQIPGQVWLCCMKLESFFLSQFPVISCTCVFLFLFDFDHNRGKKTNTDKNTHTKKKQIGLRMLYNTSWLIVYFVIWGRASTSCVCSVKALFPTLSLLGMDKEMWEVQLFMPVI